MKIHAQCTEIWNTLENSVFHTSRNHNDEFAEVPQPLFSEVIITMRRNGSESYYLQNWVRFIISSIIDFIKNYRQIIYKTDF